jgi:hypothetical protein
MKKTCFHRANGNAESLSRFSNRPLFDVAEQHRLAKRWRQAIDCGGQQFPPFAPPARFFRARAVVDEGLPARLRIVVRAPREYFESSAPAPKQHKRLIHSDTRQPSGELRFSLKIAEMKEGFVETFLYHVFGVLSVVGYSLRHGKNSAFVTNNQLLEGMGRSSLCGCHQCVV